MLGEAARTAGRCRALFRVLLPRRSTRSATPRNGRRHLRGPGDFGEALGAASALRGRASAIACRRAVPRLLELARAAKARNVGFTIDAEEADRLDLSLEVIEALRHRPRSPAGTASAWRCRPTRSAALPVIDWLADLAHRADRQADGAPGQGRLLGCRDQAGAGARPRRLPGVHPQGDRPTCRYLACAPTPARPTRRLLSAVRHAQRAYPGRRRRDRDQRRRQRRIRIPAPARHGRGAVRPDRRRRPLGPRLPGLCAGRRARGSAGLSGAPPAGERRQLLVRQSHRRRQPADRRPDRRSGPTAGATALAVKRQRSAIPLPRDLFGAERAQLRRAGPRRQPTRCANLPRRHRRRALASATSPRR